MASSQTKAISFRIPVETYADLLQEATNKRFNLTELLYSKLFSNTESKRLEDVQSETERKLNEAELRINQLEQLNEHLNILQQDAITTIQKHVQQNEFDKKQLVNEYREKVEELEAQNAQLNAICRALKEELLEASEQNDMYRIQLQRGQSNDNESKSLQKQYEDKVAQLELGKKEDKKLLAEKDSEITRLLNKYNDIQSGIEEFKKQYKNLENKWRTSEENVSNLQKEVLDYKQEVLKLSTKHNRQIRRLHDEIKDWDSYTDEDAQSFNEILWK